MKKCDVKIDTKNESDLKRVYKNPIYPIDAKINSDKEFVKLDKSSMGGTHWWCFYSER